MVDEKDTSEERSIFFEIQASRLKEVFSQRRINFYTCQTQTHATETVRNLVKKMVAENGFEEVAFSDSVTLHQLGIYEAVESLKKELGFKINNPFERFEDGKLKAFGEQPSGKLDIPKEEYIGLQKQWLEQLRTTLLSDILIIGANAITSDGNIVSTDGAGNRVSGMIFGPRKVIIVVGRNKVTNNIEEAIKRNRNLAAPLNYIRHNEKHHSRYNNPCLTLGKCVDCNHPRRACLNTVIVSGCVEANRDRIHLVFVNEDLGL